MTFLIVLNTGLNKTNKFNPITDKLNQCIFKDIQII